MIGAAYFVQLDATDPDIWYMKDLQEMFEALGVNQKQLVLAHLSDNRMPPHGPEYVTFYNKWAGVLRNYWWNEDIFLEMKQQNFLKWFPLGYSNHIKRKEATLKYDPLLRPSFRNHTLFFLGNKKSGNHLRAKNVKEITTLTSIVVLGEVSRGGFAHGSRNDYIFGLFNSKFCLQIPGRFAECYRFYDSLEAGCIPVFIDNYVSANYSTSIAESLLRLEDILWVDVDGYSRHSLPFLRYDNVSSMEEGLNSVLKDSDHLLAIFLNCQLWWKQVKEQMRVLFRDSICIS